MSDSTGATPATREKTKYEIDLFQLDTRHLILTNFDSQIVILTKCISDTVGKYLC